MAPIASPSTRIFCRYANMTFDPELANMTFDPKCYGSIATARSVQDKKPPKAQRAQIGGPFRQILRGLILAMDLTRSLRGPMSICRPFSQKRASILRELLRSFHPCPG